MTRAKRSKPVKAGLPPADARAIEDTAVHVMAAKRAGVHVIATSDKPTSSLTTSRIVALRSIGAFSFSIDRGRNAGVRKTGIERRLILGNNRRPASSSATLAAYMNFSLHVLIFGVLADSDVRRCWFERMN